MCNFTGGRVVEQVALNNIAIVLCRPFHPGNIGSAARAMKTMGLSDLRLVTPHQFPDPQAETMACGAVDVLEKTGVFANLPDALADCSLVVGLSARTRNLAVEARDPRVVAEELAGLARQHKVALVFGNETYGLSNEELGYCQALVHIPANPEYSSLNLAAAVQVMCYELRMASLTRDGAGEGPVELATQDALEGYFQHLEQVLVEVGFLDPLNPGRMMPRLRRLYARARLEPTELNILRGILTETQRSLKNAAADNTANKVD